MTIKGQITAIQSLTLLITLPSTDITIQISIQDRSRMTVHSPFKYSSQETHYMLQLVQLSYIFANLLWTIILHVAVLEDKCANTTKGFIKISFPFFFCLPLPLQSKISWSTKISKWELKIYSWFRYFKFFHLWEYLYIYIQYIYIYIYMCIYIYTHICTLYYVYAYRHISDLHLFYMEEEKNIRKASKKIVVV